MKSDSSNEMIGKLSLGRKKSITLSSSIGLSIRIFNFPFSCILYPSHPSLFFLLLWTLHHEVSWRTAILGVAKEIAILTVCDNIILWVFISNVMKKKYKKTMYKEINGKGEENDDQQKTKGHVKYGFKHTFQNLIITWRVKWFLLQLAGFTWCKILPWLMEKQE